MSELRRLKDLETENSELKRLLADEMLDNDGLKGLFAKNLNACRPSGRGADTVERAPIHSKAGVQAGRICNRA